MSSLSGVAKSADGIMTTQPNTASCQSVTHGLSLVASLPVMSRFFGTGRVTHWLPELLNRLALQLRAALEVPGAETTPP